MWGGKIQSIKRKHRHTHTRASDPLVRAGGAKREGNLIQREEEWGSGEWRKERIAHFHSLRVMCVSARACFTRLYVC